MTLKTSFCKMIIPVLLVAAMLVVMVPLDSVAAQSLGGQAKPGYNVNVRSGPGAGYSIIGRVYGGQQVTFMGRNGDSQWLQLQAEGVDQWVNIAYMDIYGDVNSLPVTNAAAGNTPTLTGTIGNAFVINVRTGPGIAYASVGRMQANDTVMLSHRSANSEWVRIAGAESRWIGSGFIVGLNGFIGGLPVGDAPPPSEVGVTTNIANAFVLNVRSGPGPTYPIVRKVTMGDQIHAIARNSDGSWIKLASVAGTTEWINSYYTTASGSGLFLGLPIVAYTSNPSPNVASSSTGSVTTTVPTTGARYHTVQAGQNLFRIGLAYGVDVYTLAAANGIANVNSVYVGQVLIIP